MAMETRAKLTTQSVPGGQNKQNGQQINKSKNKKGKQNKDKAGTTTMAVEDQDFEMLLEDEILSPEPSIKSTTAINGEEEFLRLDVNLKGGSESRNWYP